MTSLRQNSNINIYVGWITVKFKVAIHRLFSAIVYKPYRIFKPIGIMLRVFPNNQRKLMGQSTVKPYIPLISYINYFMGMAVLNIYDNIVLSYRFNKDRGLSGIADLLSNTIIPEINCSNYYMIALFHDPNPFTCQPRYQKFTSSLLLLQLRNIKNCMVTKRLTSKHKISTNNYSR